MNSEPDWFDADAEQTVSEILTEFQVSGTYPRERLAWLVQLATSEDQQTAPRASRAFFTSLVEALADSFEPAAVSFYNQAFAHLIQACRKTERGRPLDQRLTESGLLSEAGVLARAERLRPASPEPASHLAAASGVNRVLVLSRVTLGADVAITSLIVERFETSFPQAEIVLVGGKKVSELFGGDPRLAFEQIGYPRGATALDRLLAWVPLVDRVSELTANSDRCLIVDPDSRLSQLGLLPLTPGATGEPRAGGTGSAEYLFFPSREYGHDSTASLSELTLAWLDKVLGPAQSGYPIVRLARSDLEAGRALIKQIKRESHPVITTNFGVGGNESKRVGDNFERQLVGSLLRDGATVVLDKGAGTDEDQRADGVIEFSMRASNGKLRVIELDEEGLSGVLSADRIEAELIVWSGRVGLLAALIGQSDLYVGYDSAGQHIAAAMGVPCIDVFAGFSSRKMLDRWRPTGGADTRVVAVEHSMTEGEVLAETLRNVRELRGRAATTKP